MPDITFIVRITGWNFVRVPKACTHTKFSLKCSQEVRFLQYKKNQANILESSRDVSETLPCCAPGFILPVCVVVMNIHVCSIKRSTFFWSSIKGHFHWNLICEVGDLFPTGPISGIFVLWASISSNRYISSEIDLGSRLWIPLQIVWWIHVRKIKNRSVVTKTGSKMAKITLTSR